MNGGNLLQRLSHDLNGFRAHGLLVLSAVLG
jgi:hypothetical protein